MASNKHELQNMKLLMRSLSQLATDGPAMQEFLERTGHRIVDEAKSRAPVKSGSLRRAITFRLLKAGMGVEVGVFNRKIQHARIQEIGGTIKVKNARYLTIPLDPKYEGKSPRSYDLVFVQLGGKRYMVDRATGKTAYRLKKTVKIRPQPYLRPAFEEYIDRHFQRTLNIVLDKYFGDLS